MQKLELALLLEVFVEAILAFDPPKQVLDPIFLIIDVKLAQLVLVFICEPLSQVHIKEGLVAHFFALLDPGHDVHRVLVFVLFHLLEVLANGVIGIELQPDGAVLGLDYPLNPAFFHYF